MTHRSALPIAVVGAGIFGQRHARVLSENPHADLRLIVDPNVEQGRAVADRFGCGHVSTVEEALAQGEIEAFTVAVPDRLHLEAAEPLLAAGKAVLVEKPMAHSLEAAQRMREVADKSGARLMVGQLFRFDGRYLSMRKAVEAGAIGTFLHGAASRLSFARVGQRNRGNSSVLWYLGIHEVDAIQWISGERITEVSAAKVAKHMPTLGVDSEDAIVAIVRFASGAVGQLCFGWSMAEHMPAGLRIGMELVGTAGTVELNTQGSGVTVYATGQTQMPEFIYSAEVDDRLVGSLAAEFGHFVRSVVEGTEFAVPVSDAMANVAVNDAILRSVRSGQWEKVEPVAG
ncbi:Gfo/Idh/MocA family oxidoreductase [Phytohabitans sp. ZYX-F-186]|uniref:Gfo/Idh/MocA family oxidoreductase n=1 Tax=Phytohabitans maris TaxID=3071409 RepID=A0ABU0ZCJ9_9ACTN|nr:Gfo/Idh/MocA family oxidoreductase [Phytohabitans sp. ZYX-F-186]MDQ7904789.1 Gfo/Idh/MocA family oxidoreductase [Phytohabitans sp. ZYX-F-186]